MLLHEHLTLIYDSSSKIYNLKHVFLFRIITNCCIFSISVQHTWIPVSNTKHVEAPCNSCSWHVKCYLSHFRSYVRVFLYLHRVVQLLPSCSIPIIHHILPGLLNIVLGIYSVNTNGPCWYIVGDTKITSIRNTYMCSWRRQSTSDNKDYIFVGKG